MPKVTFIEANGKRHEIQAEAGQSLLEIAHNNHIALEGACEGSLACSTCHVIVDGAFYDKTRRSLRQRRRHAGLGMGANRNITAGMPDYPDRCTGWAGGNVARGNPQHAGGWLIWDCAGATHTILLSNWKNAIPTRITSTCVSPTCINGSPACPTSRTTRKPPNESILEAIQMAWIDERE